MEKKRLFVDMDGVLAVFNNQISSTEQLYEDGYFRNLEPQQNVVDAIKQLISEKQIDVYILSSYLADSLYALPEKNGWLDEHLPELPQEKRLFVPCGKEKRDMIPDLGPNDYLLDDYTHNLLLWQPPARGIKLLNDINHTQGTWQYDRISYNRPPESIAQAIKEVILEGKQVTDKSVRFKKKPEEKDKDIPLEKRLEDIKQSMREKKQKRDDKEKERVHDSFRKLP